jgi:acyl carrier protein
MNIEQERDYENLAATIANLRAFIAHNLGRGEVTQASDDDDLFASGLLDSIGIVELIAFIEEKYSIELDLSSVSEDTFGSLIRIARSIAGKV